jgi:polysaccharide deacetylase family protein (PEP-CTERM system associated)
LTNALSFDVEEYFHVHAFKDVISRSEWDRYPERVVDSTRRVLALLRRRHVTATFFILGWVAEKQPNLVREIASDGHEIASHGYAHQAVYELSQLQFRDDLARADDAIRSAYPEAELAGYRAPSFSINERTPWAFEELVRAGFRYDSSLSPVSLHDRYGVRGAPRFAHVAESGLVEIPPSTVRLGKHNVAAAGGGHFRLAPLKVTHWAIRRINSEGHPAVTYLHPWEFDPGQPRIRAAGWKSRFRHYVNINHTESKLERLLRHFPFGRIDAVFSSHLIDSCATPALCVP